MLWWKWWPAKSLQNGIRRAREWEEYRRCDNRGWSGSSWCPEFLHFCIFLFFFVPLMERRVVCQLSIFVFFLLLFPWRRGRGFAESREEAAWEGNRLQRPWCEFIISPTNPLITYRFIFKLWSHPLSTHYPLIVFQWLNWSESHCCSPSSSSLDQSIIQTSKGPVETLIQPRRHPTYLKLWCQCFFIMVLKNCF